MSEPKNSAAPCFVNGQWSQCPDVLAVAMQEHRRWEAATGALGYALWSQAGQVEDSDAGGLCITVFSRAVPPRFMIAIDGGESGPIETVYAATITDTLDLLARWAPAVDSSTRAQLMNNLERIGKEAHSIARTQDIVQEHLLPGVIHYLEEISKRRLGT